MKKWLKRLFEKQRKSNTPQYLIDAEKALSAYTTSPIKVVDVGSCRGNEINHMSDVFESMEVHCFEPNVELYYYLTMAKEPVNMKKWVHQKSLVRPKQPKLMDYYPAFPVQSGSMLKAGYSFHGDQYKATKVQTTTFDKWLLDQSFDKVDLLNVDTSGTENDVLLGAFDSIYERKIGAVIVNISWVDEYAQQSQFSTIHDLMEGSGYRMYNNYDIAYDGLKMIRHSKVLYLSPDCYKSYATRIALGS